MSKKALITRPELLASVPDGDFSRLDRADGKADGVYDPTAALKRAKARVATGGADAYARVQEEHRLLEAAVKAAPKGGGTVAKFRAAEKLAKRAVREAEKGFRFQIPKGTREYHTSGLAQFDRLVSQPLLDVLRQVRAGALPYERDNPDRTPIAKEGYRQVNLDELYQQWAVERDARAVPLQRQAGEVWNTNYGEYTRLNAEAAQIMKDAEGRIFGQHGLSLADHSFSRGANNVRRIPITTYETPPAKLYDERVPAAETILGKAEKNRGYREELSRLLKDGARLAVLLNIPAWQTSKFTPVQAELRKDLETLMGHARLHVGFARDAAEDVQREVLST